VSLFSLNLLCFLTTNLVSTELYLGNQKAQEYGHILPLFVDRCRPCNLACEIAGACTHKFTNQIAHAVDHTHKWVLLNIFLCLQFPISSFRKVMAFNLSSYLILKHVDHNYHLLSAFRSSVDSDDEELPLHLSFKLQ